MKKMISAGMALLWLSALIFAIVSDRTYIPVYFPNGEKVIAEIAVTDEERILGLMFREKINSDQGMLFIFEEEELHSIWMKNMKFAIDILWLDEDRRIVHIEESVPPCKTADCPSYMSDLPALYVLELKSGFVKMNALQLFDRLDFILDRRLP